MTKLPGIYFTIIVLAPYIQLDILLAGQFHRKRPAPIFSCLFSWLVETRAKRRKKESLFVRGMAVVTAL